MGDVGITAATSGPVPEVAAAAESSMATPVQRWLTTQELGELLGGIPVATIRGWRMIGTGPFMVKSYQKGVNIVFERNPDYFMKDLPYLDGVVIEITPDATARLALLRSGKVELGHMWGYLVPEDAKSLKQTNPEMVMTPTLTIGQDTVAPAPPVEIAESYGLAREQLVAAPSAAPADETLPPGPVAYPAV